LSTAPCTIGTEVRRAWVSREISSWPARPARGCASARRATALCGAPCRASCRARRRPMRSTPPSRSVTGRSAPCSRTSARTSPIRRSRSPVGAAIRLVKGAYKEPADRAFPRKKDVDENYFALAEQLLAGEARAAGVRAALATHDLALIRRIIEHAESSQLGKSSVEFQMLYGIQPEMQRRLARDGWQTIVL